VTAAASVAFGTGPAGRAVPTALVIGGARVRMVNRSGRAGLSGVETAGGHRTGWDEMVASTVDCYRTHTTYGLVEASTEKVAS
jgi:hypothetical protein